MGSREPKHLSCPTHGAVWGTIYKDGSVDYDCGCHAAPTPPAPADAKCNAPGCSVCAAGLPHTTHSYPMTAPADDAGCVCGEPTTKGVVHRTDGPCFHRPGPRWDADPLAPEDHAKCAAERHPADDASGAKAMREALAANERDRSAVARSLAAFDKAVAGREWLTEGRGPYEWDDDRYRLEFGHAIDEFRAAIEPLRAIARDMTSCPRTAAEVAAARAIPLPATDDAVEEARKTVVANAKAWVARPVAGRGAYKATAALEESIEALLAAESDAALRRASARRARREASVSSVPMPRDLSEEAVAKWLHNIAAGSNPGMQVALRARAVRALLREKVRLAADVAYDLLAAPWDPAEETAEQYGTRHAEKHDAIVSRVLGEEAPRG